MNEYIYIDTSRYMDTYLCICICMFDIHRYILDCYVFLHVSFLISSLLGSLISVRAMKVMRMKPVTSTVCKNSNGKPTSPLQNECAASKNRPPPMLMVQNSQRTTWGCIKHLRQQLWRYYCNIYPSYQLGFKISELSINST